MQLVLTLGNNTGQSWDAFEITTEDNSVPVPVGSDISSLQGGHKFVVHFHPGTLTQNPMHFLTVSAFNNEPMIELSNGLHGAGDLTLSNFFLHERNLKNEQNQAVTREFLLFLTPHAAVSEPGSWALLALGGLVLITQRIGRRHPHRLPFFVTCRSSLVTLSSVCRSSP